MPLQKSKAPESIQSFFIFMRPIESGSLFPVNISLFQGRTILIVDGSRGDGKLFVARADEKLTAFVELESATRLRRIASTSWRDFPKLPGIWKHAFHQF
jgi:hypothetical protein